MNFVEELRWRGMLHDMMPGTEELLAKEQVTAYIGFDPTADSLHIGHLCSVMILRHFQRCGHKPLALIGGATGMIGDPSGKSAERNLLTEETLQRNLAGMKAQLSKFLDFDSDAPNRAELVNNYDWMKNFTFLDFAREVGKHITVNYMMAKDSVKKRLNGEARDGLSFTEFTYQLLQGYDFLHLYETKGCKLQMGGSDQWDSTCSAVKTAPKCCIRSAEEISFKPNDAKYSISPASMELITGTLPPGEYWQAMERPGENNLDKISFCPERPLYRSFFPGRCSKSKGSINDKILTGWPLAGI